MACATTREVGEQVKTQLSVWLWVGYGLAFCRGQRAFAVTLGVSKRPRLVATKNKGGKAGIEHARESPKLKGACGKPSENPNKQKKKYTQMLQTDAEKSSIGMSSYRDSFAQL